MLCILQNGALQKDAYLCIDERVGDMTGYGSLRQLFDMVIACATAAGW